MLFILKQSAAVIIIMSCALFGTVGIIKLIKRSNGGKLPKDRIAELFNEKDKRR